MFRHLCGVLLAVLLAASPAAADTGRERSASAAKAGSTGKRVAWTVIGAAAGFGAGLFLGLNQFDDAIDSDRKVWTSALVGAAAGGVAGNLLSRNVGRAAGVTASPSVRRRTETVNVSWAAAIGRRPPAP
jgi:uncharacterized protein YcfJ